MLNFISFFTYKYQKYSEFYADFKSRHNCKKMYTEGVICKKLLQVSSIEEDILQFFAFFSTVLKSAQNSELF